MSPAPSERTGTAASAMGLSALASLRPQLMPGFGDPSLNAIEEWRSVWREDDSPLVDGSLEAGPFDRAGTIAQMCKASRGRGNCSLLHFLTLLFRPVHILELGTNMGISAAYLAMAQKATGNEGKITTVDASQYRLRHAQHLHEAIGATNVKHECGRFNAVVPELVASGQTFDMIFIDAQLEPREVRILFEALVPAMAPVTLYLQGNVETPDGASSAWNTVRSKPNVYSSTIISGIGAALLRAEDQHA